MAANEKKPSSDHFPFLVAISFSMALILLTCAPKFYYGPNNQWPGLYKLFDSKWFDFLLRHRGMEPADNRITIVTIDDESIKRIGVYPWPRNIYSHLLDNLFSLGTKVVGLDVIFPDRSPSAENDAALVESTRKWGDKIVHAVALASDLSGDQYHYQYAFPALKAATKHMGFVDQQDIDGDGIVRATYLVMGTSFDRNLWPDEKSRIPSLGLQMVAVYRGKSPDELVKNRPNRERNIIRLNIRGQQDIEKPGTDVTDTVYGIRRVPAWKILDRKLAKDEKDYFRGGIVLLGSVAKATYDHFPSAFADLTPGVEVHANVIDNLLNDREFRWVSDWWVFFAILLFSFLAIWTSSLGPLAAVGITLGILCGWYAANLLLFNHLHLIKFAGPTLALAGPFTVLFVRKTRAEQEEKKFIKQTFGQYLAPEVVEQLVQAGGVRLGGDKKDLSVLFLDIAHFTNISEKLSPEALIDFLNFYLTGLTDVILKHRGTVDKYIGDCVMAFWGAPIDNPNHRSDASKAAIECQQTIDRLNREYNGLDGKGVDGLAERPAVRIGLNSGSIVVGNTGSAQKKNYTVIGDEVNLASRLEGANKFFGSKIMVSEACFTGAKDAVDGRYLGAIRVIGKEVPIKVFEPLGLKGQLSEDWQKALPLYNEGIRIFYQAMEHARKNEEAKSQETFAKAKAKFLEVLNIVPKDGPAKLYLNMSEDYCNILPPPPRDGVINMTSK